MRTSKAFCIYLTVTWLLLLLVVAAGILAGAGNAAGWGVAPLSMIFVILVTFGGDKCGLLPPTAMDVEGAAPSGPAADRDAPLMEAPPRPPRLHWLDNAKAILITMVVIGHSATEFVGSGAFLGFAPPQTTWFMPLALSGLALLKPLVVPLFFLISGYFSAAGLASKGRPAFLRASFWRLGPPYFLWWLVVNPANSLLAYALARPTDAPFSYFPGSAATWFLSWLLVFQSCYALLDGVPTLGAPPSWSRLALISLGVAAVQLVASLACVVAGSTLGFGSMPMAGPGGDGFINALGFAGGVLARTNGWLASPIPSRLLVPARRYALVVGAATLAFFFVTTSPSGPSSEDPSAGGAGVWWYALFFALQLPLGPYAVSVWLLALDLFQRRCDKATALSRFASGAAFAVYLLHYFAVTGFAYVWALILEQAEGIDVMFVNSTQSATDIGDGANLYLGWLFVATTSVASSFAVGGLLKRVPGLRAWI